MVDDILSTVLSYAGWAFLPRYVTSFLQNIYYRITIRAGDPHPSPSSPRYARHYRRIYIAVIASYLLYTLYETYHKLRVEGDFYQLLGVLPTSNDRTIKSRFRRLAALHHPDKRQSQQYILNSDGDGYESPDALFVQLRLAQDTLLDPVKRFAYDRFGQAVVEGSKAKTMGEFLFAGLRVLLPQYIGGFIVMVLMNLFWLSAWGRYWRFYISFALLALELALLTHHNGTFIPASHFPTWLSTLLHLDAFYLLPFQSLILARNASMTLNIFISHLTPPDSSSSSSSSRSASAGNGGLNPPTQAQLTQLVNLARANEAEATRLLQLGLVPFKGDEESAGKLRRGMKEVLVLGSVRDAPEVKEASGGYGSICEGKTAEQRRDVIHIDHLPVC
ncbi:membrane associated DnaJ chaperone [Histoplasma capsulatum]|uniref:Membrane associated DnaJ chaperone n=1 Tax=Ajellomyces capsulatus TaxID=5037 RepID=A0A8A1M9Q0_AJECA|nr:membrane associated DnaJ chaperone [Histoplasma capsulatum]